MHDSAQYNPKPRIEPSHNGFVLPRFYVPDASDGRSDLTLPADEAHHATRVLRLRAGDEIAVFDGRGREWRARIAAVSKSTVQVRVEEPIVAQPEPRVAITLVQAVLKGDHMDAVIRDATMAGVSAIVPVLTAHTVVSASAATAPRAHERWTRVAIASAKQCRRAAVPFMHPARDLAEAFAVPSREAVVSRIVLVEPSVRHSLATPLAAASERAVLAVGPEGGWSAHELNGFADAGFAPLTLGAFTLRADAAALVAVSALRARWDDL